MSYEFSAEERDGFVHVKGTGQNTPDTVRGYLRGVYERCARTGASFVLIEENLRDPRFDPVDVEAFRTAAEAEAWLLQPPTGRSIIDAFLSPFSSPHTSIRPGAAPAT